MHDINKSSHEVAPVMNGGPDTHREAIVGYLLDQIPMAASCQQPEFQRRRDFKLLRCDNGHRVNPAIG
jgi:hypothetical protein